MTPNPKPDTQRKLFRDLLRIRRVEERIIALYPEQEIRCPTHFSLGQEAVAAGVCDHLSDADLAMSAHRSHAHYLAKGGSLRAMLAELYGKADGCARGKGGSMHLIDRSVGFLGCVPIVGSTIPIAVGASFGSRLLDRPGVTAIFFGDGAVETGVFAEALSFAALHALPVLFVCENNLYSVNTGLSERQPEGRKIVDVARGLGVPARSCDGQVLDQVWQESARALDDIRANRGPFFLEFMTYRWLEHCGPQDDRVLGYRPPGEYEAWFERCPVRLAREHLLATGVLDDSAIAKLEAEIGDEIAEAVAFAKVSPFPVREELLTQVYAD